MPQNRDVKIEEKRLILSLENAWKETEETESKGIIENSAVLASPEIEEKPPMDQMEPDSPPDLEIDSKPGSDGVETPVANAEVPKPSSVVEKKPDSEVIAALETSPSIVVPSLSQERISPNPHPQAISILPEPQENELIHGVPKSRLFDSFPGEFQDLETYVLALEDNPRWKVIGERQGLVTRKLSRSKFSSEVPVFQCKIDFQERIPADFILNMFDDPDYRMTWDSRITQMNKIYISTENSFLHYHLIHFNAPLEDRDFLVKYYVKQVKNETRIIFKSISHNVK